MTDSVSLNSFQGLVVYSVLFKNEIPKQVRNDRFRHPELGSGSRFLQRSLKARFRNKFGMTAKSGSFSYFALVTITFLPGLTAMYSVLYMASALAAGRVNCPAVTAFNFTTNSIFFSLLFISKNHMTLSSLMS